MADWIQPAAEDEPTDTTVCCADLSRNLPEGQYRIIIANRRLSFISKHNETCRIHRLPERCGMGQGSLCSTEFTRFGYPIVARRMRKVRIGASAIMTAVEGPCRPSGDKGWAYRSRALWMRHRPI